MTAPLHPDLAWLQLEYERVCDSFDADHITFEQARATLRALAVIDADGAVWGVDEDGNFVRRRTPDAAPEVCNPALFAVARAAPAPGAAQAQFPRAPWEDGPAPADQRPASFPRAPWETAPGPQPGAAGTVPSAQPPGPADGRPAASGGDVPAADPGSPRPPRSAERLDVLRSWASRRRSTLAVAAVVVVFLVGAVLARGGGGEPDAAVPSSSSAAPSVGSSSTSASTTAPAPTAAPATTGTGAPSTTAAPGTTAPASTAAPAAGDRPRAVDVDLVQQQLASGVRENALKWVVDPGSTADVTLHVAFYAGLVPTQTGLRTGDMSVTADGVTQLWVLFDRVTGAPLAQSTVTWRLDGATWKLASWPKWSDVR